MFSKSFVAVVACAFALSGVVRGAATPLRRSLDPSLVCVWYCEHVLNLRFNFSSSFEQCYALTQDFANYLDSTSSVLQLQNHPEYVTHQLTQTSTIVSDAPA